MKSKDYLDGALDTAMYVLQRFRTDSRKAEELLKELDGKSTYIGLNAVPCLTFYFLMCQMF
ncbi:MAG: hypothetical protein AB1485_05760 [Candidatus Thermoplasmatota archaeon]